MDFDPTFGYVFLGFCIVTCMIEPRVEVLLIRILDFLEKNQKEMLIGFVIIYLIKTLLN